MPRLQIVKAEPYFLDISGIEASGTNPAQDETDDEEMINLATISQIVNDRAAAGAAYAAAVETLHQAYVELAAHDDALSNGRLSGVSQRTFGPFPDPVQFRHPVYLPNIGGNWMDEVRTRRDQIVVSAG